MEWGETQNYSAKDVARGLAPRARLESGAQQETFALGIEVWLVVWFLKGVPGRGGVRFERSEFRLQIPDLEVVVESSEKLGCAIFVR